MMAAGHCPFYNWQKLGVNPETTCSLTNSHCEVWFSDPKDCKELGRLIYLVGKAGVRYRKLTEKGKDYLMFAYRKVQPPKYWQWEPHIVTIVQSLQRRCARIATERCRADDACPFKALLPEYDVT
jgi:hypothetical protein